MMAVKNGQLDATLQDSTCRPVLSPAISGPEARGGRPSGGGTTSCPCASSINCSCNALDQGINVLLRSGEDARAAVRKYNIWRWKLRRNCPFDSEPCSPVGDAEESLSWARWSQALWATLLAAAGIAIGLSVLSMPLAIVIGLLVRWGGFTGRSRSDFVGGVR